MRFCSSSRFNQYSSSSTRPIANAGMISFPPRCTVSLINLRQLRAIIVLFVDAIAVGGLDEQVVGFGDRRRIRENRPVVAAEVAAEEDRLATDAHAGVCGTEQVPGIDELHLDARRHGHRRVRIRPAATATTARNASASP